MSPFFSYYGSKYTGAKHYGPPRRERVVEPFSGSACYSLYWEVAHVDLYDKSQDICDLWDYLIHSSNADIKSIPSDLDQMSFASLPRLQRLLCGFWVAKGRAEPSGKLSPWYFKYRNSTGCRVWGEAVKARIIKQKERIKDWRVDCLSYEDIPLRDERHWHVDPPYNNAAGMRYPNSDLDYRHLGEWVRTLPGSVDVCENVGATWLPFDPLYSVNTARGRRTGAVSLEGVYSR